MVGIAGGILLSLRPLQKLRPIRVIMPFSQPVVIVDSAQQKHRGAEMDQCLKALAALVED